MYPQTYTAHRGARRARQPKQQKRSKVEIACHGYELLAREADAQMRANAQQGEAEAAAQWQHAAAVRRTDCHDLASGARSYSRTKDKAAYEKGLAALTSGGRA